MDKNRLICFIACVVVIHACQVIAADLGHMNIKLHKLSRKHDALQQEVDDLWATIIRSGIQKLDHGNQTKTDDDINTQELFTKVNKKLSEMEDLKKEIKILILYSRTGLKNEKAWQKKAMKNMTSEWENLKTTVETENKNLDKTFRDTEDSNDKRLSKMETENTKLRNIIAEVQNDYKKIQENNEQELSNVQAENRELRNILAVVKQDYEKVQENMEAQIGSLTDTINELREQELFVCDEGWEGFNGHCYLHQTPGGYSWDGAAAFCESMDSHLVEITSDAEMQFINEFTSKKGVQYGKWTGATDRDDQGNYVYQHSKLPVPEKFWRKGEPNNENHHCVDVWDITQNGTGILEFFDWPCSNLYNAVCEKSW